MLGSVSVGSPGAGFPSTSAMARAPTSRRSVTRSAKYPPRASNCAANTSIASATAPAGPFPALRRFVTSRCSDRSRAIIAVALRMSRAVGSALSAF
ncbi:Uncharacterised protein [Mycobacteroides abscessus subsp. abscessus]|nr:Uncharacterised protein [Mycobacteroides abscessus subsp. abscessus]